MAATLKGKTILITGASRGIGKAIGLKAARDGANVVIVAKTVTPDPKLPGTIQSAADEMIAAGGKALACAADIRSDDQIARAVAQAVEAFGGIDILVNNASAISLTGTLQTPMNRFDLLQQINVRGTYACAQACLPFLLRAENPHILNMAPPLKLEPRWFAPHAAYSISKFGMSLCTLGMAEEFKKEGVAVNSLWPRTAIATAAIRHLGGEEILRRCRSVEIVADAAHLILTRRSRECSGNFFIDEEVLASAGVTDFSRYAVEPDADLIPDFFI
ncbi:MAG TPA: NAD(P)-dependent oxidoreductase [Candidatus Manganitrophaceae bacterium]|nr:NAD(P)-dependent oxidoreductase [Candidatus Manganitrophaceae bacterium]